MMFNNSNICCFPYTEYNKDKKIKSFITKPTETAVLKEVLQQWALYKKSQILLRKGNNAIPALPESEDHNSD